MRRRLVKRFSRTLMDEHLLDALGYPHPNRLERAVGPGALRLRARFDRFLPPRSTPLLVENLSPIRSYPGGYDVRDLGTFTPTAGCPVPHEQTG